MRRRDGHLPVITRGRGAIAALVVIGASLPATASASEIRTRRAYVTGLAAIKADSRLWRVPDRLVTGQLKFQRAYFASVAAGKVLVSDFNLIGRRNSLELEGQVIRHFGRQDHFEGTVALALRTGEIGIVGGTRVNFMWGNGISYAFERPRYESGDAGIRGVGARQFQYLMLFESEFSDSSLPGVHLVLRLHHRSGVYGLISSDRTGANHIAAGLRFDLR